MGVRAIVRVGVVVASVSAVTEVAQAGIVPPPWDPTAPMQTLQAWTFTSGPFQPFVVENPNGPPEMHATGPAAYLADNPLTPNSPGTGVWCLPADAALMFFVPNYDQQFVKEIFVSIKYSVPEAGVGVPFVDITGVSGTPGTPCGPTYTVEPVSFGVSMIHYLDCLPTCEPFFASISFPVGIPGAVGYIEQVVIQTRCIVPSPGSAMLLILAAGVAAPRRRRS